MGRDIQPIKISGEDRRKYRDKVRRSLEVFARMLRERLFEASPSQVGQEIEPPFAAECDRGSTADPPCRPGHQPRLALDQPVHSPHLPSPRGGFGPFPKLANIAHFRHRVALAAVRADPGVGGVPLRSRFGIEPVNAAHPPAQCVQQVGPWRAVVSAGVAADEQHAVPGEAAAVGVKKLLSTAP